MDLAGRLRDLRIQAGLTKTALAKPRYTVSYVSQIEAGRRTPSSEAMAFFARQLGVSPNFLATGIPEGIEDELRYRLEVARTRLREADPAASRELAGQVLARAAEYDLEAIRSEASLVAAEALAEQGRLSEAIDAFEEVLERELPERERALAVVGLARAYRTAGDLMYASQVVESFLGESRRGPLDPSLLAELQSVLVSIYFERGDMVRAERAARHALAAVADVGSLELRARTYWYAARVLAEQKKWSDALEMSTRARMLMEELDDRQSVARLHNAYAFLCLEAEPPRLEEARHHLDRAEALLSGTSARGELAYIHEERGRVALLAKRPDEALEWAERGLAEASPDGLENARCLYLKGRALSALERGEEARQVLREAADRFGAQGARQQEASCWRELGEIEVARGDLEAAVDALRAGLAALDPNRTRA
ncbi:MAG: helix-turn-helix transcriptional regulator [Actinobacteria bacterium]|nr:MAG: helix-turn-helix transcriptional regulator [Actinomycetota bacterium]